MSRFSKISTAITLALLGVGILVPLFGRLLLAGELLPRMRQPGALVDRLSEETQPVPALSPFIDVHVHMTSDAERSVQTALQAIRRENAAKIIFMPSPFTVEDTAKFDADFFLAAVKQHPGQAGFSRWRRNSQCDDSGSGALRRCRSRSAEKIP